MFTTITQHFASSEWLFVLDSDGFAWERPIEEVTGLPAKWERLPKLPGGITSMVMSPDDGVLYAVANAGANLYQLVSSTWTDVTPPFSVPTAGSERSQ